MKQVIRAIIAVILTSGSCYTSSGLASEINITAMIPDVTIETRARGRKFVRLPTLEYAFVIDAQCRADLLPSSLTLSIADTRVTIPAEDIPRDAPVAVTINIPADQIGPVAVEDFCVGDESRAEMSEPSQETISIPSVLSVQASLLCTSESGSEMTYASQPVNITLACAQPPQEDAPAR